MKDSHLSERVVTYIKDFGQVTTLHGIRHMVQPTRHFSEIYLWTIITALAAAGALAMVANNWQRYNDNPTVISLEKNYRVWKLSFPAATVCLLDRVNETLATQVIHRTWGVRPKDRKFRYYMRFVKNVANLTYENLEAFEEFKRDPTLANIDMASLALKVLINLTYNVFIFNPKYNDMEFKETVTEMGVCFTYSGVLPSYISLRKDAWKIDKQFVPPYCNFLNSLCYARVEDLPRILKYYIHSPYELPDISDRYYIVEPSMERDTTFRFQQTVAADDLRRLTPKQRRCRFMDEPADDMVSPVYSYNLCRMNCRKKLAYELCQCAPYFYTAERVIRVCGVKDLASCLAKYATAITTLKYPNGKSYPCHCYLMCTNTNFYLDKDSSRQWLYPVPCNIRFRWAIELYSKTRLKREIIFGLEDLLVSFGGAAAFFLGCSVITFVELFYFFTLRLYWFLQSKPKT